MKKALWLTTEIKKLRECYPYQNTKILAKEMGRTHRSLTEKAHSIGLKKAKGFSEEHRFEKGDKPWNKGIHYNPEGAKKTQFKPGVCAYRDPKPLGTERIRDGRLYRKVAMTGVDKIDWKRVKDLVWEEHHGPIPKGMIVALIDFDPKNCAIDNLMLVTNAELLKINNARGRKVNWQPVRRAISV